MPTETSRDLPALFVRGKAVLTFTVALVLLVTPSWFFAWFGLTLDPAAQLIARLLGAAFLAFGIKLFMVRASRDLVRADCRTFALADGIGAVTLVVVMVGGLMNVLGWVLAGLYAAGSLGFAMCARRAAA